MAVVPKIVVIGAGFGGLEVARHLKGAPVEVTLVDQHNFHTFQPLLYQVATAGLNAADVAHVVRGLFHRQSNVRFLQGQVTGVDWDARAVTVADQAALPFDHLVLAGGATVTYFGTPGAADHGFPLYTLADATHLRNHIVRRFEAADTDPTELDRGGLTFVVVGGGPTGVETAGAMAELFAVVFRKDYPALDVSRARVVLVEMQDHLLDPFKASSRRHALDTLAARGVEVRLGAKVTSVAPDHVTFADGEVVPCQTLVWAAGVQANPLAATLGLPQDRGGRVVVGPDLRVPDHPDVWAIGDIAATPRPPRRPAPPAGAGGDAERPPRRAPDPPAAAGSPHRAVPLPRQGHHGDHRPARRGGGAAGWHPAAGRAGVAGVAGPPPRVPGRQAQPAVGAPQLGLELRHLGPRPPPHPRSPRPLTASVCAHHRDAVLSAHRTWQCSGMTADATTIRATVEAYCAAFAAGDQDAYLALFTPDAWIEDPIGSPRVEGHEGLAGFFTQIEARWRSRSSCARPGPCGWRSGSAPSRCRPVP